jgi:XTP/dITP diphosphohydrolase
MGKLREASEILGDGFSLVTPAEIGLPEDIPETGKTLEENSLQKARYIFDRKGCDCFSDDTGLEVEALGGAPGVYTARFAGPEKDFNKNMDKVLSELSHLENRLCHPGNLADQSNSPTDHPDESTGLTGNHTGHSGNSIGHPDIKSGHPGESIGHPELVSGSPATPVSRRARFRCVVTLILDGNVHQFEGVLNGTIARTKSGHGGFGYDPIFIPDEYPDRTLADITEEQKNAISHRGKALRAMAAYLAGLR